MLTPIHDADPGTVRDHVRRPPHPDADAYRHLLIGIVPCLRAIADRAHANASDAEDTVQNILLAVHEVCQTCDASRPVKPRLAVLAKLKTLFRKADSRTVEKAWRKIGTLLDLFPPKGCAAYISHAGCGPETNWQTLASR